MTQTPETRLVIYAGTLFAVIVRGKLSRWNRLFTGLPPFPSRKLVADIHHMVVVEQLSTAQWPEYCREQFPPIDEILVAGQDDTSVLKVPRSAESSSASWRSSALPNLVNHQDSGRR